MKLTAQVQLLPTTDQASLIIKTITIFNTICNYVSKLAFDNKCFHPIALHNLKTDYFDNSLYYHLRQQYPEMSSIHIELILRKVADAYRIRRVNKRKIKKPCVFKNNSAIIYNHLTLSVKYLFHSPANVGLISLRAINSRELIHFIFGEHQSQLIKNSSKIGEMKLIYRNKRFYLNISTDQKEADITTPISHIGVDLGVSNIATTSYGKIWSGAVIDNKREKFQKHRSSLQKCGTPSAKRRLKKVAGKEALFRKDINHCISKELVAVAKGTNSGIVLEDLKYIRERITVRKQQRARHHGWSFAQLREFISYKAFMEGVEVKLVDPHYTSQRCSNCGHIERKNRKSQYRFLCLKCGHDAHADYNAACNLASMGNYHSSFIKAEVMV